jgi:DNA-binding transcriptional LysR family regulator
MDADLLKSFLAVADLGGFSAAGKQLGLTQSAVSLRIKRLEGRLGITLFNRTSRSVALTEAGAVLVPYAQRVLRLNGEAEEAIVKSAKAQNVRVGMTDEQAVAYLPYLLPIFTRTYPEARLEVVCDQSPRLVERVHDGLLDLAITIRHPDCGGGTVVGHENLRWIAARDFSPAAQDIIPLAVNPDGCVYRASAIAALNRAGRRWRIAFTSANPTSTNIAVKAALGISVKTERALPDGCRLLGPDDGLPPLGSVVVEMHLATSAPAGQIRAIRDLLLEAAGRYQGFTHAA